MTQGKEDEKKKVYRRPFLLRGKDTKVKKGISELIYQSPAHSAHSFKVGAHSIGAYSLTHSISAYRKKGVEWEEFKGERKQG